MKLTKTPPKEDMVIVDGSPSGDKRPMCKLFRMVPHEVSEVQYDREAKTWTTDTGLRFRHSKDMIRYYEDRVQQQGQALPAGTYAVAVKQVQTSADRVVLQTREGGEIIIKLS